jgi:hypothetical protein
MILVKKARKNVDEIDLWHPKLTKKVEKMLFQSEYFYKFNLAVVAKGKAHDKSDKK